MKKNNTKSFEKIIKRNERIDDFDSDKIYKAILKAGKATKEFDESIAKTLTIRAISIAEKMLTEIPTVEDMQDIVEETLLSSPFKLTAKAYIIYREQHFKIRETIYGSKIYTYWNRWWSNQSYWLDFEFYRKSTEFFLIRY